MARTTVDTWHGYDKPDVVIEIPIPFAQAGSWHGEIRARLVDEETGDWFFQCDWRDHERLGRITTFPVEWCRRAELDDFAGIIPAEQLERMRRELQPADSKTPAADAT